MYILDEKIYKENRVIAQVKNKTISENINKHNYSNNYYQKYG